MVLHRDWLLATLHLWISQRVLLRMMVPPKVVQLERRHGPRLHKPERSVSVAVMATDCHQTQIGCHCA